MSGFLVLSALALVAALLAATGAAHLVGLAGFARTLLGHGLMPAPLALPAALAVAVVELGVAAAALGALAGGAPLLAAGAFAAALVAGAGFLLYLRRLVRSGHAGSCGCSPLPSALTPASFAPAAALAAAGAIGLVARWADGAAPAAAAAAAALPVAWGATLAGLFLLLPATAPAKAVEADA